jgi:hydrogenase 3 maturation protease
VSLCTASGRWCIIRRSQRPPEDIISTDGKIPSTPGSGYEILAAGSVLAERLREPCCLVGVGNPLRRDDGVGPWIIGAVRGDLAGTRISVIDAQDVPENFVHVVARAECRNVIFIDAVAAPGPPGTIVFGPLAEFPEAESLSTHKLALSFSGKFLESAGKTVFLLGIVAADLAFGAGLTPPVARTAEAVRDFLRRAARRAA